MHVDIGVAYKMPIKKAEAPYRKPPLYFISYLTFLASTIDIP
jgi:hypothetical protein